MSALLEVSEVVATYGAVRALDRVSLSVSAGGIVVVLGANGAGKTSLLRTVSGLLPAAAGQIAFDGRDLGTLPPEERVRLGIAHVPEGRGVIAELSVEENLRLGALWRRKRAEAKAALGEAYALFPPLAERRKQLANSLSGGERQMLSIGRGLMGRPRLLLLDEPSLGLAPRVAAQIMGLVARLRDHREMTVLLVEQNARTGLSIADDGVVLNVGKVVARGRASELSSDERLRHAYLGF